MTCRCGIRAYDDVSPEFTTISGVREDWSLSPFVLTFVIEMVLEITLFSCENSVIDVCRVL